MARSMNRWFEETIEIIQPKGYDYDYLPMPSAPRDYPIIQ